MSRSLVAFALFVSLTATSRSPSFAATPPAPPRPLLVTVDDLPMGSAHESLAERRAITKRLLAALARHRIHAVGFVTWGNLRDESETELLDLWLAAGHELGNHTFHHPDLSRTDSSTYLADVESARVKLDAFLKPRGKTLRFFRFPFLDEGDTPEKLDAVREYLSRTGQRNLPVTIDDQDWSFERSYTTASRAGAGSDLKTIGDDYQASLRISVRDQESLGDRMLGRTLPQVLLLHAGEVGAAQWDTLFTWLESTGHGFASADEVLADPAFAEPHRVVASHGFGLWDRLDLSRREAKAREDMKELLDRQAAAWNRGDLAEFCSIYSDDALFLSPSGLTRGRQAVLDRYQKKYPDNAARGTLSFEMIEIRPVWGIEFTPLDDARPGRIQGISVAARWTLSHPDKPAASGFTLLNFRPSGKTWVMIQDASM